MNRMTGPPRGPRRRLCRLAAASLVLALGLFLGDVPGASAHALLVSAEPAAGTLLQQPPAAVTLTFDETVQTVPGWIRVYDSTGTRVDVGGLRHSGSRSSTLQTSVQADLPEGSYAVLWRVVSADGHAVQGRFSFTIRTPSRLPSPESLATRTDPVAPSVSVIAHVLVLAGLCVLLGTTWFTAVVTRPRPGAWPAPLRRIAFAAASAGLLGSVARIPSRWAEWAQVPLWEAAGPSTWTSLITSTASAISLVSVLAFATATAFLLRRNVYGHPTGALPLAVAGSVALVAEALSGHAPTAPLPWLTVPFLVAHLAATSAWVGALPALLVELLALSGRPAQPLSPAAARRLARDAEERNTLVRNMLRRFGAASAVLVAVVALTGVAQAALQGAVLMPWMRTSYETDLGYKVAAVLVALALGAGAFLLGRGGNRARPWLTAIVAAEATAAVVVLALTALLVRQAPARTALYEPQERTLSAGPVTFTLQWSSLGEGVAAIQLDTVSRDGSAVNLSGLGLQAVAVDGSPARVSVVLQEVATGEWISPRVTLPRAGLWALETSFTTVGGDRRSVTAQVLIV